MSFRRGGAGCLGSDQPRSMWRKRSGRTRWAPHYRILACPVSSAGHRAPLWAKRRSQSVSATSTPAAPDVIGKCLG